MWGVICTIVNCKHAIGVIVVGTSEIEAVMPVERIYRFDEVFADRKSVV